MLETITGGNIFEITCKAKEKLQKGSSENLDIDEEIFEKSGWLCEGSIFQREYMKKKIKCWFSIRAIICQKTFVDPTMGFKKRP